MDAVYRLDIKVPAEAVDINGHVNNVMYVQWMQDVAVRHAEDLGGRRMAEAMGATWVVRTHQIEYFRPAFAGDTITVLTWVSNFRKVRSLRKYKFIRMADQTVLVRAQTDWVFLNATTGRPLSVPDNIWALFTIVSEDDEPK